jgi:hypothetical protein
MNLDRHISMTQITWIIGTLLGLTMAVFMGSAIGSQDFTIVVMVLGAGIGIATFLILGKNYWMLIPFSLGASFPAVPIGGRSLEFPEIAIVGCSVFFALRVASRKEKLHIFRTINIPILLFMAWVGMVFVLNPIGLAMLGAQTGGARFYFKLALGFAAFLLMSNREYTERDIKWIFGLLIFGAIFSLVYGFAAYVIAGPQIDPTTGMVMEEFYTWHQLLAGAPVTIIFLVFARWSPREIFGLQRPWLLAVCFICFILVLLSGKRIALVSILLAPLVGAVLFKQYPYIFIGVVISIALLTIALVGQGQMFRLPLTAQRTLSWLPGDWDPELKVMEGGSDEWRAELRRYAMDNIKRDPWIGRGFAIDVSETISAISQAKYMSGIDIQTASYALGRAWHNRWLGYAADFGIPLSIIQLILFLTILRVSYLVFRDNPKSSLWATLGAYVFIVTVKDVVASWTSGHTALDAFQRWWYFGVVIALYLATKRLHTARATAQQNITRHKPSHAIA